jgi:hypothetical protein
MNETLTFYTSVILFIAFLVPVIIFFNTQYKLLRAMAPHNRKLSPGWVWLQLVPYFGSILGFIVVSRVHDAVRKQYAETYNSYLLPGSVRFYRTGIAYCISGIFALVPYEPVALPAIALFFVFWIIYWVQLVKYKRMLTVVK